jgi:hypothetical protein
MICEKLSYMPAFMQTVFCSIIQMQRKAMTDHCNTYDLIIYVFLEDMELIYSVCNVIEVISANVV